MLSFWDYSGIIDDSQLIFTGYNIWIEWILIQSGCVYLIVKCVLKDVIGCIDSTARFFLYHLDKIWCIFSPRQSILPHMI